MQEKIWTPHFLLICITNFLLFFAFYALLPILPEYLLNNFKAGSTAVGITLSLYAVGALLCRPFAGYLVDSIPRKKLYIITYFIFAIMFCGYIFAGSIALIALVRFLHGLSFGIVSTSGNTVAIDVLPSKRRGEGIGYFGVTTNLAFALGPMFGVLFKDYFGTEILFRASLGIGIFGLLLLAFLRVPLKIPAKKNTGISLDRFFLINAVPQFIIIIFVGLAYGPVINYMNLYAEEIHLNASTGYFYALIAVGMIASRLITSRYVDKGYLLLCIKIGFAILCVTYAAFSLFHNIFVFFGTALFVGIAHGFLCPGYQTMFVNMARHDQRGTASSTYLSGWDLGIGIGVLFGGIVAEISNYATVFFMAAIAVLFGFLLFLFVGDSHYRKNRLEGSV
ncbi:MAG: MFS transporter [Fibrobacteraceae bacterium]|jgi:predicted MFS family arabinose efflux permease|nr:MFS transporter [Fibrobacteraceae bacterium]MEE1067895.1 MFS transporter [Fibrobacteraceae bacterium]